MKDIKYIVFWIAIIYLIELAIGYLISIICKQHLSSTMHNVMCISFGFLIGVVWVRVKNK